MLAREILLSQLDRLSQELTDTLDGLTAEQLNQAHGKNSLTIGFNAWHVFRTMDNIVNFVMQRSQPVWLEKGYMEKLELPKTAQGTGMDLDEAQGLHISDADVLRAYGRDTLASVRSYVETVGEDDLREVVTIKPMGEMPRWRALSQIVITHCSQHLGEMSMARGLIGLRGAAEPATG